MATVRELAALYENVMLAPLRGPGVCETCLTFTEEYAHCYVCATCQPWLDAVSPISYSIAHEQLHHALVRYKRLNGDIALRLQLQLTAVLWRYLERHEACLARRVGVPAFSVVTTVPSGVADRDRMHPLPRMVGDLCGLTRERYRRLLERSESAAGEHDFDPAKYRALTELTRQPVLLIDDTWTTGSSAQSAAAALKRAGAGPVAVVVIGRHLKRDWRENDARLHRLARPFDWEACVHCAAPASVASAPQWRRQ